eukprot:jgi/Bigna1/74285/fgenesh1_pg.28_\
MEKNVSKSKRIHLSDNQEFIVADYYPRPNFLIFYEKIIRWQIMIREKLYEHLATTWRGSGAVTKKSTHPLRKEHGDEDQPTASIKELASISATYFYFVTPEVGAGEDVYQPDTKWTTGSSLQFLVGFFMFTVGSISYFIFTHHEKDFALLRLMFTVPALALLSYRVIFYIQKGGYNNISRDFAIAVFGIDLSSSKRRMRYDFPQI